MKKGFKSLAALMSIVTVASALAACSSDYTYPDAVWDDGKIAYIGGKTVGFNEIFELMDGKKDAAKAMYSAASNILAQFVTPRSEVIISKVDQKIDEQEETWKSSASSNGTSYKEEQEKTFESEGVLDEEGLRNKWIAEEQVSQNKSDYGLTYNGDTDKNEQYHISETETKKFVETTRPYHVSHVLIKVDAGSGSTDSYEGQISSDNAKKIGDVVESLVSSDTFGDTALRLSDDSSNTSYGDLFGGSTTANPLMKSTSYVNEFKLGLYSYEAFINKATKDNTELKEALHVPGVNDDDINDELDATMGDTELGQGKAFGIPLTVALDMRESAEQEKSNAGYEVVAESKGGQVTANQYPRNILFNNYFNNHEINFIYDDRDEYATKFIASVNALIDAAAEASGETIPHLTTLAEIKSAAATESLKSKGIYLADMYDSFVSVCGSLDINPETGAVNANGKNFDSTKFQEIDGVSNQLVTYASNSEGATDPDDDGIIEISGSKKVLSYPRTAGVGDSAVTTYSPVLITRAGSGSGDSGYQGIHFIVVNNDPFGTGDDTRDAALNEGAYQYRYYRVNKPDTTHTDTTAYTAEYNENPSIVNFLKSDLKSSASSTFYNNRILAVESTINGYDSNTDFKIWESNLAKFKEKYKVDFMTLLDDGSATTNSDMINLYINQTRSAAETSADETLDDSWQTYVRQNKLYEQYQSKWLIPTSAIAYFQYGEFTEEVEEIAHVKK